MDKFKKTLSQFIWQLTSEKETRHTCLNTCGFLTINIIRYHDSVQPEIDFNKICMERNNKFFVLHTCVHVTTIFGTLSAIS
jgi:hypothetical protein